MSHHHHHEKHFTGNEVIRDIVLGMSDGLTVPFALAAGLTGTAASTQIIVIAGLAEIAAGSVAMGLGGFLAAKSDMDHYANELRREHREVREIPHMEKLEVEQIFQAYGISAEECAPVVESLSRRPRDWVDFMMRFELGLEEPMRRRAYASAVTIAISYIVGGFIPLAPYILIGEEQEALRASVIFTLLALGVFGYVKGRFLGMRPVKSAIQTMLIGGLAAGVAFLIARWIA